MLEMDPPTDVGRKLVGIDGSQAPRYPAAAEAHTELHRLTVRLAATAVNCPRLRHLCVISTLPDDEVGTRDEQGVSPELHRRDSTSERDHDVARAH